MYHSSFKAEWAPVAQTVAELAMESGTREVWLIGSRANGSERETSDWDLMVFSDQEPVPVAKRRAHIDVLHAGPMGHVLLEGKSTTFTLQLTDFKWSVIAEREASYLGKKFVELSPGELFDLDAPRYVKSNLKALLLWSVADGPFLP